jgi:predicted transcriptional regulator of viral defense system
VEFVAALMRHLGQPDYYVGWLAAAALHGAAHHAPQVTQVATGRPIRDRVVGRIRVRCLTRSALADVPIVDHMARSGPVRVSSPEATLMDLAADLAEAGGIDNVANVVAKLADERGVDVAEVVRLARSRPAAVGRRLGWLLEHFTTVGGLDPLAGVVAADGAWSLLDSMSVARGSVDPRWNVKVNADVEVDL